MFTGTIEQKGEVVRVQKRRNSCRLMLSVSEFAGGSGALEQIKVGESISVNGACLTVSDCKRSSSGQSATVTFDITGETLARTNLSALKVREKVNIERALKLGDRLGGHFVTGHIDGTGRVKNIRKDGENVIMEFTCEERLCAYMIEKGSVAVEGISLTITEVTGSGFCVALIPHTLTVTTLGRKNVGDAVNIECDILAKLVAKLVGELPIAQGGKAAAKGKSLQRLSSSFLAEHGFT
jgi:riboflavin synthase